jgi:integrase/recombinase XerD
MARRRQTRARDLLPLLEPWLAAKAQRSKGTATTYRYAVTRFLEHVGDRPLNGETISSYLESLDGLLPATRASNISAVRAFLRHGQNVENPATGQPWVDKSPVEWLVRPHVAVTSRNRYLTAPEIRKILKAAGKRGEKVYAIVLLLATTGLRISEMCALEWRHVYRDPHGNLGLLVQGKGGKQREVAITEDLWNALRAVRALIGKSDELDAKDRTPLIPTKTGGRYSREVAARHVKRAVEEAKIGKPASPHWFRHGFGTMAVLGGVNVFSLKETMGHARLETTQLYVKWVEGLAHSAVHSLPKLS